MYGEESDFISKTQFRYIFNLTDLQSFQIFRLFDLEGTGKISTLEIFGALCLATNTTPFDKIGFCFQLTDANKDGKISPVEFEVSLRCISRGFSCLKALKTPPLKLLKKLTKGLFSNTTISIDENGEVELKDVRAFILANDDCRAYFGNLGNGAEVLDAGAYVY
jgi:hypothetical protein